MKQLLADSNTGWTRFSRTLFNKLLDVETSQSNPEQLLDPSLKLNKFAVIPRRVISTPSSTSRKEDESRHQVPYLSMHLDSYRDMTLKLLKQALTEGTVQLRIERLRSNTTVTERMFVQRLMTDSTITIKPADKNLGMVMVDTSWYVAELTRMLSDKITYRPIKEVTFGPKGKPIRFDVTKLKDDLMSQMKRLITRHRVTLTDWHPEFSDQAVRFLESKVPKSTAVIPEIYLLIKVHKLATSGLCGRPIVPSTSWITTPASILLDHLLQEIVRKAGITWIVKDTKSLVNELERTVLPQNGVFITADISSLYTNIDTKEGLAMMKQFLIEQEVPMMRRELLMDLLEFVMNNSYLSFQGQVFHQIDGTAMGTAAAPIYANIFVYMKERSCVGKYTQLNLLHLYRRLLDDVLAYVDRSLVGQFARELNQLHPKLKFDVVTHDDHAIFLDLHIHKGVRFREHGIVDLKVHQKAMNLYLYIPFNSFHTEASKRSFIQAELIRYIRNTSSYEDYVHLKHIFYQRLRDRGYPASMLNTMFSELWYCDRPFFLWPASQQLKQHPLMATRPPRSKCLIKRLKRQDQQEQSKSLASSPPVFILPFSPLSMTVPIKPILTQNWWRLSEAVHQTIPQPIMAYQSAPNLLDRLVYAKSAAARREVAKVSAAAHQASVGPKTNQASLMSLWRK